jgi:exopolysaccharide biosynthesis polyprenyl glycosylphosphotransferase
VAIISLAAKLDLARAMVAIAIPLATLLTGTVHFVARRSLHRRRGRGACMHRVLVVGLEHQVADLVRHFRRSTHAGMAVVGACVDGGKTALDVDGEAVPVLGGSTDVVAAMRAAGADVVAVADHATLRDGALRRLGWELEGTGVDLLVAPSVIDVAGPRIAVRPVAGLPLLHVAEPELDGAARLVKEAVERVVAGVALVFLSPVLVALAVAVRVSSRGPALFAQERVGQHGRLFTLYKFRTMVRSAEVDLVGLAARNEHDGPLFKMRQDPRRTRLGRRLRRLSLDELPQLWNVVAGQMSIVGPRPPLPAEVEDFSAEARRRLLVKPGLTGLWQVSGRANLPWKEAVRLDLYYVENWSPALDLVILAKTVTAVLRGHGAY